MPEDFFAGAFLAAGVDFDDGFFRTVVVEVFFTVVRGVDREAVPFFAVFAAVREVAVFLDRVGDDAAAESLARVFFFFVDA